MKTIELTQEQVAQVSDVDYEYLMQWKWRAEKGSRARTFYAVRSFKLSNGVEKRVYMHREVLIRKLGRKLSKDEEPDHVDGDGLSNQRENLRPATRSQNKRNARKQRGSSCVYKGVSKRGKRWRAQMLFQGRYIYLGSFTDPVDAAKAYDSAARKYYGEFAKTNF